MAKTASDCGGYKPPKLLKPKNTAPKKTKSAPKKK